jgi:branched-chain amino acid transport system ATP-binding protein
MMMHSNILSQALYWGFSQKEQIEHREAVERIIDFLQIENIRRTPASMLPYGMQKRVELGRALAAEPKLLLLDEPMAGMNLEEKEDIARFVLDANEELGYTIALIEHDMGVVMDICDRIVVLDEVIKAYLGTAAT